MCLSCQGGLAGLERGSGPQGLCSEAAPLVPIRLGFREAQEAASMSWNLPQLFTQLQTSPGEGTEAVKREGLDQGGGALGHRAGESGGP